MKNVTAFKFETHFSKWAGFLLFTKRFKEHESDNYNIRTTGDKQ